jgi:hypothetical protein
VAEDRLGDAEQLLHSGVGEGHFLADHHPAPPMAALDQRQLGGVAVVQGHFGEGSDDLGKLATGLLGVE